MNFRIFVIFSMMLSITFISSLSTATFFELQEIQTQGIIDSEFFVIDGKSYIAIANHKESDSVAINSTIFFWDGTIFKKLQDIPTFGAYDIQTFKINNDFYLAIANNYNDNKTYSINSKIYKWNGTNFIEFQSIPTVGAASFAFFEIEDEKFIAIANRYSGNSNNIDSIIYKWNGNSFVTFQSIPTKGATDIEHVKINNDVFLAIANEYDDSSRNIYSKIYKWNGHIFTEHQSIKTYSARDWESFVINDEIFLAVANFGEDSSFTTDSKIYKWNGNIFEEYQSIQTSGANDWDSFYIEGRIYIAVANYMEKSTDYNYNIDSKIYQWDGESFIEYQAIETNGGFDFKFFSISNDSYVLVGNYRSASDSFLYKWNKECNYNDKDGDGVIDILDFDSNTPLDSAVYADGRRAENLYNEIDTLNNAMSQMYTKEQVQNKIQAILDCCDTDKNGKISLEEIINGLEILSGMKY